jgi:DNA-binding transcriptional regulator GbsR (MarR family)
MKTMNRPFEGILGNTIELRIVERLIASPNATFNPTDLARMTGISRDSATKAIKKLNEWNVMSFVKRKGNMDLYMLNSDEPMVMSLKAFNDSIIMRMFPEVSDVLEELEIGSGQGEQDMNHRSSISTVTMLEPCVTQTISTDKMSSRSKRTNA